MASSNVSVAIVGGGPSGICAAIQLTQQLGLDYTLFEKSARVGGTWLDNRYPGAECDVPSHLYSYSFDLNMKWTKVYSPAPEILAYFEDVAVRHGVLQHSRLSTTVTSVTWSEASHRWNIAYIDQHGKTGVVSAKYVISCVGALHVPRLPDIPGVSSFRGTTLHTAKWDPDAPLDGKTVAIIGTGASTVQLLPAIASRLHGAYVFQRSAPWVMPRNNRFFSSWARALFSLLPGVAWMYRWLIFVVMELVFFGIIRTPSSTLIRNGALRRAHSHRTKQLQLPQPSGVPPGAKDGAQPFLAVSSSSSSSSVPALRASLLGGQSLETALTPGYPLGCKRILSSDDYLATFTRPNVALVTLPILRITASSIVVGQAAGVGEIELPVDAIIFATGFDVLGSLINSHPVGRGGVAITREWAEAADNYYGIVAPGLPNFFMCLGPNTGLGHNSIIAMVEPQVDFMLAVIRRAKAQHSSAVEVTAAAAAQYMAKISAALEARTVWPQCSSWYNLEGRKNVTMWPFTVSQYWWETKPSRIDWAAFQFEALEK